MNLLSSGPLSRQTRVGAYASKSGLRTIYHASSTGYPSGGLTVCLARIMSQCPARCPTRFPTHCSAKSPNRFLTLCPARILAQIPAQCQARPLSQTTKERSIDRERSMVKPRYIKFWRSSLAACCMDLTSDGFCGFVMRVEKNVTVGVNRLKSNPYSTKLAKRALKRDALYFRDGKFSADGPIIRDPRQGFCLT